MTTPSEKNGSGTTFATVVQAEKVSPAEISRLNLHLYKPHPFPNPVQGDILEVEDDATVAPWYFFVTVTVLVMLIILSLLVLSLFVLIVNWRRKRRPVPTPNPQPPSGRPTTTTRH